MKDNKKIKSLLKDLKVQDKKLKSVIKSEDRILYAYNYDENLTEEEKDELIFEMLIYLDKKDSILSALSTAVPAFFLVLGFVLVFILKV